MKRLVRKLLLAATTLLATTAVAQNSELANKVLLRVKPNQVTSWTEVQSGKWYVLRYMFNDTYVSAPPAGGNQFDIWEDKKSLVKVYQAPKEATSANDDTNRRMLVKFVEDGTATYAGIAGQKAYRIINGEGKALKKFFTTYSTDDIATQGTPENPPAFRGHNSEYILASRTDSVGKFVIKAEGGSFHIQDAAQGYFLNSTREVFSAWQEKPQLGFAIHEAELGTAGATITVKHVYGSTTITETRTLEQGKTLKQSGIIPYVRYGLKANASADENTIPNQGETVTFTYTDDANQPYPFDLSATYNANQGFTLFQVDGAWAKYNATNKGVELTTVAGNSNEYQFQLVGDKFNGFKLYSKLVGATQAAGIHDASSADNVNENMFRYGYDSYDQKDQRTFLLEKNNDKFQLVDTKKASEKVGQKATAAFLGTGHSTASNAFIFTKPDQYFVKQLQEAKDSTLAQLERMKSFATLFDNSKIEASIAAIRQISGATSESELTTKQAQVQAKLAEALVTANGKTVSFVKSGATGKYLWAGFDGRFTHDNLEIYTMKNAAKHSIYLPILDSTERSFVLLVDNQGKVRLSAPVINRKLAGASGAGSGATLTSTAEGIDYAFDFIGSAQLTIYNPNISTTQKYVGNNALQMLERANANKYTVEVHTTAPTAEAYLAQAHRRANRLVDQLDSYYPADKFERPTVMTTAGINALNSIDAVQEVIDNFFAGVGYTRKATGGGFFTIGSSNKSKLLAVGADNSSVTLIDNPQDTLDIPATAIFYRDEDNFLYALSNGKVVKVPFSAARSTSPAMAAYAETGVRFEEEQKTNHSLLKVANPYDTAKVYYLQISTSGEGSVNVKTGSQTARNITIKSINHIPFSIGQTGWATLSLPVAVEIPADVQVYTAERVVADRVYLSRTPLTGTIPANTPVVVTKGNAAADVIFKIVNSDADPIADNVFTMVSKAEIMPETSRFYSKTQGKFVPPLPGVYKRPFVAFVDNVPVSNVQGLSLQTDNILTDIEAVQADSQSNAPIYDLQGRRVDNPVKGYIYIQAGKTFILR